MMKFTFHLVFGIILIFLVVSSLTAEVAFFTVTGTVTTHDGLVGNELQVRIGNKSKTDLNVLETQTDSKGKYRVSFSIIEDKKVVASTRDTLFLEVIDSGKLLFSRERQIKAEEINLGFIVFDAKISGVSIPDSNLRAALEKALGKNEGDAITKEDLTGLRELDVSGEGKPGNEKIKNLIGLEHCTNLTKLALERQQIDKVTPLSNLTNLTSLKLAYNPLVNLIDLNGISKLTKLQHLTLTGKNLKDLNGLSKFSNLRALHIWSLHSADFSVFTPTNFPKLVDLALNDSFPTEIDMMSLAKMVNLTRLNLSWSRLTDAHIKHLTALTELGNLDLSRNQITDITALSGLTQLSILFLKENQISDLSPLVQNEAIFGDKIQLLANPLSKISL